MDAFAVSIAIALSLKTPSVSQTLRLAVYFGLFQFAMPVAGWFAGHSVIRHFQDYEHWIAFVLLTFIGVKMIREAGVMGDAGADRAGEDPTRGPTAVMLSVATSIDALAVGFSLSLIGVTILYPAVVIGAVAFALTAAGMRFGPVVGKIVGKRMEDAGGLILIAIGLIILIRGLRG